MVATLVVDDVVEVDGCVVEEGVAGFCVVVVDGDDVGVEVVVFVRVTVIVVVVFDVV